MVQERPELQTPRIGEEPGTTFLSSEDGVLAVRKIFWSDFTVQQFETTADAGCQFLWVMLGPAC